MMPISHVIILAAVLSQILVFELKTHLDKTHLDKTTHLSLYAPQMQAFQTSRGRFSNIIYTTTTTHS